MRIHAAFGLLLCMMAFGLTACGGGASTASGGSSTTTDSGSELAPITKAALIKRGDVICTETDAKQRTALKAYEKKNAEKLDTPAGAEEAVRAVAFPPIAVEIEELEALGSPADDKAKMQAIYTGLHEALKAAEAEPRLVMGSGEGPFEKPDKLAGAYGFKACAEAL